jgi:hypothetical protein
VLLNERTQFHSALLVNGDVVPGPIHLARVEGDAGLSEVVVVTNEELVVPLTAVVYLRVRVGGGGEGGRPGEDGAAPGGDAMR